MEGVTVFEWHLKNVELLELYLFWFVFDGVPEHLGHNSGQTQFWMREQPTEGMEPCTTMKEHPNGWGATNIPNIKTLN